MLAVENPLVKGPLKVSDSYYLRPKSKACQYLDEVKEKVSGYKSRTNEKRWKQLTEPVLPNIKKVVCSKAYYKLDEIIKTCALKCPNTSFHICEAPGGFVQCAIAEFDTLKKWYATSLLDGIQFKTELLDMEKGEILKLEKNGNILEKSVRESLDLKVDLVTADGSYLDENHSLIEQTNYTLLEAEADIALRCLNKGGDFVCKFFEGMETRTQILICVLTNCFENVSIIKPLSSKKTNSERYLVCRGFEKHVDIIDTVWEVSDTWMDDLQEVLDEYCVEQKEALEKLFSNV